MSTTPAAAAAASASDMAARVRAFDWSRTPLGPRDRWPQTLRTLVDMLLAHPLPMIVLWGPDLIQIYNDGYAKIAADKHPAALGQPTRECWPKVWHINAPIYERVLARGESVLLEDQLFPIARKGVPEDAYFTLTYSPVRGEGGQIGGVILTVLETTAKVRAERDRERRQSAALAVANLGTFEWDVRTNAVTLDDRSRAIFGFAPGEGTRAEEVFARIDPADFPRVHAEAQDSQRDLSRLETEYRLRLPDGTVRTVASINDAIPGPDGRVERMVGVFSDVTARRRADEARRKSEFRFQRLVEHSPQSTQLFHPDGRTRQVNRAFERLFGITLEQLRDYNILRDPELVRLGVMPLMERAFAGEAVTIEPIPYVPDRGEYAGQTRWAGAHLYPVKDEGGRVEEVVLVHNDVTEQRLAEEALRDSEQRLRSLVEQSAAGIAQTDLSGRILFANERYCQIVGCSPEEVRRLRVHDLTHPDDLADTGRLVASGAATGHEYSMEKRYVRKDGSAVWVAVSASVIKDTSGTPQSIMGVVIDISDRKRAEAALRGSEERLRFLGDLGERTRDMTDPEQVMTTVAGALGEHLRVSRCAYAEVEADSDRFTIRHDYTDGCQSSVGTYRLDSFGPRAAADQRAGRTLVIADVDAELAPQDGGDTFRAVGIKAIVCCPLLRQGRLVSMMAVHQATPRPWSPDEVALVEVVVERSRAYIEQARAIRAVAESEARFRQLADAMPQMMWVTRPDGHHEYYNRRWYEFTGVPEGSTDGEGWNGMFHPADQDRAWAAWRHSLATGEPYEIEYRLRHRSGEYRWTLGRALPVRNGRGDIERWFGTCTDIDAMKRLTAEREHLLEREQSARAEAEAANRAKDKFLAVLSHELRTPLSPVVMTIPSMEIDPEMPFKFREDLAMVRRNIDLEVKLIDDLLDLSRVTSGKLRLQMQPLRVHELLAHVIRSSAGETAGKHLHVRHGLDAKNDLSSGDPARLQQVFWNLMRNAVKFTPEGGNITVRTWNRDSDGRLLVEVMDSGVGIPPEVLPRVFDAFEQGELRMTRQFGGLGLGLAIAKAVVEMHGGSIRADSDGPGRGATFTVELATARGGTAREPHPAAPAAATRHARSRVLLVEDHPDTSRAMASLLTRSGYEVKAAHSVASALQLAAAEPFDIVVSDIGLPDASGYDLMQQIRERHGIKGIALSGYGMEEDVRRSREAGFVEHVIKPVNVAQLQAVIERVLGDTGK